MGEEQSKLKDLTDLEAEEETVEAELAEEPSEESPEEASETIPEATDAGQAEEPSVELFWVLIEKTGHAGFYNLLVNASEIEEFWQLWRTIKKSREAKLTPAERIQANTKEMIRDWTE